jgi:peptidylprolyl isomerase
MRLLSPHLGSIMRRMPLSRCMLLGSAALLWLSACDEKPAPPAPDLPESARPAGKPKLAPRPEAPQAEQVAAEIPAPPDVAAPPPDAARTPSGLASKVLEKGTGDAKPGPDDRVKVHYTGWTKDGKMFDSSRARKEPFSTAVGEVIKGWTEGLQLMVVGEQRRLWIPAALAYGDTPGMGQPAGDLVFDVELLAIEGGSVAPPDVAAAPADAKRRPSGLAYKLLDKGKGGESPGPTDSVTVHYTGWTKDGRMFDSSVQKGRPASFGLDGVIKGWTEGLQLMKPGDKMRFWIPSDLAYGDKPKRPGAPAGDLVFDVELISIR